MELDLRELRAVFKPRLTHPPWAWPSPDSSSTKIWVSCGCTAPVGEKGIQPQHLPDGYPGGKVEQTLVTQLRLAASGSTEPNRVLRSLIFPSALSLYPQGAIQTPGCLLGAVWMLYCQSFHKIFGNRAKSRLMSKKMQIAR